MQTTNARLAEVITSVDELLAWAVADAETAEESGVPDTAEDDRRRILLLGTARVILELCER